MGNDIVPRPNNPFPMYVGDGLEVLDALLSRGMDRLPRQERRHHLAERG
jgi:hypothetical protein